MCGPLPSHWQQMSHECVLWRGWELAGDLRAGRQADRTQLLSSQKGKELQRLGKMS